MRAGLWLLLAAVLVVGGCSSRAPDGGRADAATLRRGNGPEPDSLDPQLARSDSAANILRDLYEGLATLDASGDPRPGAAAAWSVSADGRTYTFRIRAGARWSNGEPLTASDFVAAWQRLVDPKTGSQYAAVLEPVENAAEIVAARAPVSALGVSAPDAATLSVHLTAPTPYFPGLVAHWSTFPLHRGSAGGTSGVAVTNGAFTLSEWVVGSHVLLMRNHRYWNDAATRLERVRYEHAPDANDEYARYRAGSLDATYTLPQQPIERLKAVHAAALHLGPQLGIYYYGFNLERAPFKGADGLRRALAMSIDRERLVAAVTGFGELPAYAWVPPGTAGYTPQRFEWAGKPYAERVVSAQRLYALAGYSAAKRLHLTLSYPSGAVHERIAIAVAAMWQTALGVETELRGEEFKSLLQTINRGEAELFRSSWVGDYNDAYTFAQVLGSDFGINLVRYRSSAYDAALKAAAAEPDAGRRRLILEAAERQMLADTPLVPLYFLVNKHLVAPRVSGWYDNVMNVVYSKDLALGR